MSGAGIESILAARRLTGRDEFHRRIFELLLVAPWQRSALSLSPDDERPLLDVLSRWVRESPVQDHFGVMRLLVARAGLRNLVRSTGRTIGRFLLDALALEAGDLIDPARLPDWKQAKLSALADASLIPVESLAGWRDKNSAAAQLFAIASLGVCPLDKATAQATGDVGQWLMSVPPCSLSLRYLEHLQKSAFFVSYLADPLRHQFKAAIVRQAQHMLEGLQFKKPSLARGSPLPRPRLTIVGELLFPQHAMFRCYADILSGLKKHFEVTLIADDMTRCEEHSRFSHRQCYFPSHERDLLRLIQQVSSTHPDIILYPSVGMTYWTFVLSLMRLAPLQLMSVGHPAPSCSEHIDATLVYSELATSLPEDYGKVITFDHHPLPAIPPLPAKCWDSSAQEPPVLAITAAQMKITPRFLEVVAQVMQSAPPGTELHFFPNVNGTELLAMRSELQRWFPQAVIHPEAQYAEYIRELSKADLVLQSFPFGGTNTTMDSIALGIPMICLEGEDLPAFVDPILLRRAGLGCLCASTQVEYRELAIRLLNSLEERMRIVKLLRAGLDVLKAQSPIGNRTLADAVMEAWQSRAD